MEQFWGNVPAAARFAVLYGGPFLLVLGLVGIGPLVWRGLRNAVFSPKTPRGRQPRLAVIESAVVDMQRRLVLIRRDHTEHLLLIGGPTDIVIESGSMRNGSHANGLDAHAAAPAESPIRRAAPPEGGVRQQPFEPAARTIRCLEDLDALRLERGKGRSEPDIVRTPSAPSRIPPASDLLAPVTAESRPAPVHPVPAGSRISAPLFKPAPAQKKSEPLPREPVFQPALRESPQPPPIPPVRAPDPSEQAPALGEPDEPASAPTSAPVPPSASVTAAEPHQVTAPLPRPSSPLDDSQLAEMADRLEEALRRATRPAEPGVASPNAPAAPAVAAPRQEAASPSQVTAALDPAQGATAKPSSPPATAATGPKITDSGEARSFESIEDEMAKMLGRSLGQPPKP